MTGTRFKKADPRHALPDAEVARLLKEQVIKNPNRMVDNIHFLRQYRPDMTLAAARDAVLTITLPKSRRY